MLRLQRLDRLDGVGREEVHGIVDIRELLQRVEQHGGRGAKQVRGLARDDAPVRQLQRGARLAGRLRHRERRRDHRAIRRSHLRLAHDVGDAVRLGRIGLGAALLHEGLVVAADDLLLRGVAARGVVGDAIAGHVHAHVRGRLVRRLPRDLAQQRLQQREDLDVAVVGGDLLPVRLQVVLVEHVDVFQVRGGRLVGQVHRVRQRQVPDGEGLKLGVASGDAALVLVVHLAQAGGQLAGARPRRGHHDEVAGSLHVVVAAKAVVGNHRRRVVGVARDHVVARHLQAQAAEALKEGFDVLVVALQLRDHHVFHEEAAVAEHVHEAQHVIFVGDAQVRAHLLAHDVAGVEADDNLHFVLDPVQHGDLVVRGEPGEDAGGVVIVEKLAPHLQIEFAADFPPAGGDVLGLHLNIFLSVKPDLVRHGSNTTICAMNLAERHFA